VVSLCHASCQPRNIASARLTTTMVSSLAWPMTLPILSRETLCGRCTAICDGARSPVASLGALSTRARAAIAQPVPGLPRYTATHISDVFAIDEATIEAIRPARDEGGELSAIAELRRHFPLITDNAQARLCLRIIVGWKPVLPPNKDVA
jgi:hypothetical protein